jgi:hypothetical protein
MARGVGGRFIKNTQAQFYINVDAMLAAANLLDTMSSNLIEIETYAYSIVKEIIRDTFAIAVREADAAGGFPVEFQNHVMEAASRIVPRVSITGGKLLVDVDLEDSMGSYRELTRAYHQGALLASGGRLDGPYEGQELATDNAEDRHLFWEALQGGQSTFTGFNRKLGKDVTRTIKDAHEKWDKTKQKYIEIWGSKAPEWLFIQFGQEEWDPTVPQINIVGQIQDRVTYTLSETLWSYVSSYVERANRIRTTGPAGGYSDTGRYAVKLASPSAVINGKTYRKGQFVPKNTNV